MMMKVKKYILETIKYLLRCSWVITPYIKQVEKLYSMSNEELLKRNEHHFLKIFRRAYQYSPFYRKLYIDAGISLEDIQGLDDLKKLPVITKDIVKQHAEEMLVKPKWQMIKANTSGTTGTPLSVFESWSSIWMEQAYHYCYRKRCGFKMGQPLVSLRGHLDKRITSLTVHVSNTLFLSSYNINDSTIRDYFHKIKKHRPIAIEGYPSSLYALALCLKDANLQLNIPVAFTSSESLLDHQRNLIEAQLNTEIFDNYGMTERTICLFESYSHNGYYEAPGYSVNEFVEDGEICTSLINKDFPMIRYKSNDIIEFEEPDQENNQLIIKSIGGRNENYVLCKDGSKIMRLGFVFKGVQHVKYSQLIQKEDGIVEVRVVPENDFSETDELMIKNNLLNRLGNGNVDFKILRITEKDLVYSKRGKFNFVVNMIGD